MLLKVDCREKKLIPLLKDLIDKHNSVKTASTITLDICNLHIGDVMIVDDSIDTEGVNIMIFERKTINDLACSISDGRYAEQSFRLDKANIHNHNIIYLIEGDIRQYKSNSRINKSALYSSMISLNTYKGFSVLRTFDVMESATVIVQTICKILKNNGKVNFYSLNGAAQGASSAQVANTAQSDSPIELSDTQPHNDYIDVIKSTKKSHITKDNINEIMLSQIPGVSINVSKVIMSKYKTIKNLIVELGNDPNTLNNLKKLDNNGKERKINKTTIVNIKEFLCF